MVFLGIDPGLRNSLGWAILRTSFPEIGGFSVLDVGVEDVARKGLHVVASKLHALAERYGVSEVLLEDFLFFSEKGRKAEVNRCEVNREKVGTERKANGRVISRMQFLIGYLNGFFSARYVPVTIVSPRRWKCRVSEEELEALISASGKIFASSKTGHVLSAVGVVVGELRAREVEFGC